MVALPYMEVKQIDEEKIVEHVDNLADSWGCLEHYPKDFKPHLDPNSVVGIKEEVVAIQVDRQLHLELPMVVQHKEVSPYLLVLESIKYTVPREEAR